MEQEDHVQAIQDELDAIAAIPDRLERARAATQALQLLTDANGKLARLRREDILALVDEGFSYQKIGAAIGIDRSRVKQIQTGRPTGNSSRARAAKTRDTESDERSTR
jgi:DNA-directed RNA polymerase specialized sigma24 family protein